MGMTRINAALRCPRCEAPAKPVSVDSYEKGSLLSLECAACGEFKVLRLDSEQPAIEGVRVLNPNIELQELWA